ncbi:GNAT family N-acetyltransferase [Streptomyces sp. NPDC057638]|uniref:GNAT family N-acetyltransferase n=1 Tax=Streptomyces sp. NPDC057638 TaxID=3346190 RepID=UPI003696EAC7
MWEQHPARDRHEWGEFTRFFGEALGSRGALVVVDRRDGRLIGSSRYHGYGAGQDEAEIGWTFLARSYWDGAYKSELKRLMIRHGLPFVGTVVFLAGARQRPVPAGRRADRRPPQRHADRGGGADSLLYQIESPTWAPP